MSNPGSAPRQRVAIVTAVPATINAFLRKHIEALGSLHDVVVMSNLDGNAPPAFPGAMAVEDVPLARAIAPAADARALLSLLSIFSRGHFDLMLSVTPKAGLLAGLAARLAGVPARVHWFTGQVWANKGGIARRMLKAADRVIAKNATHALVDSLSQRDFLVHEGVVGASSASVLAEGSISGVDAARFHPDADARRDVRAENSVPEDSCLILFVGRLNRDKGVLDLVRAFAALARQRPDCHLMLVGPDEEDLLPGMRRQLQGLESRYRWIDFTPSPQRFMAAADVFCLPSYREGFGSVIIEAAACGIPAVASRIYGVTDAVVESKTGWLFAPGNVKELEQVLLRSVRNRDTRRAMGDAAQKRALESFPAARITQEFVAYCQSLLGVTQR